MTPKAYYRISENESSDQRQAHGAAAAAAPEISGPILIPPLGDGRRATGDGNRIGRLTWVGPWRIYERTMV
jgi:hypothetical protein